MQGFFWMIAILGALLGAIFTIFAISSANGAPQEADGAANDSL